MVWPSRTAPAPPPKYSSSHAQAVAEGRARSSSAGTFATRSSWDGALSESHSEYIYPGSPSSIPDTEIPSPRPSRSYISPPASQDRFIPSAQPFTPPVQPSPYAFSVSNSGTSPLPSPPASQPDDDYMSSPEVRAKPRRVSHTSTQTEPELHSSARKRENVDPLPDDIDDQLLHAVFDGMGRIHVSMDLDGAGRWRIQRSDGDDRP